MSTTTTNYGFIKPQLSDPADITATNSNWDKLDENLKNIDDKASIDTSQFYSPYNKPSASDVKSGTLAGQVKANASAVTSLSVAQIRNIKAGSTDLTSGESSLTTGEIYLVYEE